MPSQQLTLNVNLREGYRFDSFYVEKGSKLSNYEVYNVLRAFAHSDEPQQNLIWGETLSGKSHLLQACCAEASLQNQPVSYIPLKVLSTYGEDVLESLSHAQLVVIDDIDQVIGNKVWEIALFNLITLI